MNKAECLDVGVIGVGHLGQHHARIFAEMPDVRLVGVVDTNPERAREIADRCGTRAFDRVEDLVGAARAVSIVTPTVDHHRVARSAIEAGVDVLVEKPFTVTLDEADDLVRLAASREAIIQVGHVERFNGAVRVLRSMVTTPLFIECNRISPFPDRSTDVDVVLDLMIHDIDIILSLVGSPVTAIYAVGVPVITRSADIANARIEFASGCVANVTSSRVSQKKERKIRIFQPDAYLSLDYQNQELYAYRRVPDAEHPGGRPKIDGGKVKTDKDEPLRVELAAFVDAVRYRKRPLVSGDEGREALRVALAVMEDIRRHTFPL
jgi:predicted dehydrogenase